MKLQFYWPKAVVKRASDISINYTGNGNSKLLEISLQTHFVRSQQNDGISAGPGLKVGK